MATIPLVALTAAAPRAAAPASPAEGAAGSGGRTFREVMKGAEKALGGDSFGALSDAVAGAGRLSARELVQLQTRLHRLHLQTEMCAKAVDSGVSVVRRFQSGQ